MALALAFTCCNSDIHHSRDHDASVHPNVGSAKVDVIGVRLDVLENKDRLRGLVECQAEPQISCAWLGRPAGRRSKAGTTPYSQSMPSTHQTARKAAGHERNADEEDDARAVGCRPVAAP